MGGSNSRENPDEEGNRQGNKRSRTSSPVTGRVAQRPKIEKTSYHESFTEFANTPCMDQKNKTDLENCTNHNSFIFIYQTGSKSNPLYATRYDKDSVIYYLNQQKSLNSKKNYGFTSFMLWAGNEYYKVCFPPILEFTKMFDRLIDEKEEFNYMLVTPSLETKGIGIGKLNKINDEVNIIQTLDLYAMTNDPRDDWSQPNKYGAFDIDYQTKFRQNKEEERQIRERANYIQNRR
jgi:hypothetical protein